MNFMERRGAACKAVMYDGTNDTAILEWLAELGFVGFAEARTGTNRHMHVRCLMGSRFMLQPVFPGQYVVAEYADLSDCPHEMKEIDSYIIFRDHNGPRRHMGYLSVVSDSLLKTLYHETPLFIPPSHPGHPGRVRS